MFTMKRRTRMLVLCLVPVMSAWGTPADQLTMQSQSRLWVEGTSTLRSFECAAKSFAARIDANGEDPVGAVLGGEKAVTIVEVTVPARLLDCANGTMNEHMLKALKADQHGQIVFRLSSYELRGSGENTRVELTGSLNLGGTQKPVTIQAEARPAGAGMLRVVGNHDIVMTEFGLRPPKLMLGTLKVGDRVNVKFDLLLQ